MGLLVRRKDDADFLFSRIKNVAIRYANHKSPTFMGFTVSESPYPNATFHHVYGSYFHIKSTDFLGVSVPGDLHNAGEDERTWILDQVPVSIENLIKYTIRLEEASKRQNNGKIIL